MFCALKTLHTKHISDSETGASRSVNSAICFLFSSWDGILIEQHLFCPSVASLTINMHYLSTGVTFNCLYIFNSLCAFFFYYALYENTILIITMCAAMYINKSFYCKYIIYFRFCFNHAEIVSCHIFYYIFKVILQLWLDIHKYN